MNISLYMEHKIAIQRELLNNFLLEFLMFLSTLSYLLAVQKLFQQFRRGRNRKYLKYVTTSILHKIKKKTSRSRKTGRQSVIKYYLVLVLVCQYFYLSVAMELIFELISLNNQVIALIQMGCVVCVVYLCIVCVSREFMTLTRHTGGC